MIKLANATMHPQTRGAYEKFGFEVEVAPRLKQVSGAAEAYNLALEVVENAKKEGFDGLLLGGRTDIMIYLAIEAPICGLKLYQTETVRERDENDRFVFNIVGVTQIFIEHEPIMMSNCVAAQIDVLPLRALGGKC